MKGTVFLILLLLSSFGADAGCTFQTENGGLTTINLDMTSGTATNKINLNSSSDIVCTANSDSLYYTTPLKDYIVAIQGSGGKKILIKINLTSTDFPVSIGKKTVSASEVLNTKNFTITASYVNSGTAKQTVSGDAFSLTDPGVSITSENSCTSNWIAYLFCWATGRLSSNSAFTQNLSFTVTHKPTTCQFSLPRYEIKMPDTTINEMMTANNTKSGTTNLVLNCNSIYNVTTNPVNFKVVRGDWDESGKTLKNTIMNGAKGVGFQIYNGTATTPLKLGDTLMSRIAKLETINNQYIFPITAKYVRVTGESLRPGEVQSKVIFAVSYD
ncbi:fimbrial protein [Citrobacter portucalensis]|uniref:fimbrial protein n=1 Tax=Citrobacter portucalensis TaxID=1639133 RepID=UPI00226B3A29|nr:fimbrial protein [Citrobacter portucalensis]MCX9021852.1 fimbrial protein [Citrobacter portucalensis]